MKSKPFTTLTAGFAVMLAAPAFAIEAPADDAPPPRTVPSQPAADAPTFKLSPAEPGAQTPAADAAKPATAPQHGFLGVVSGPIPALLTEHLGLKEGEGIVVQALIPQDGPAAKAGLALHDVITRVADQPVTSALDFSKLVASHKPGEKIHLDVIHQGKPAGVDVTLGTRPEGLAMEDPQKHDPFDGIPKDLADRVRGAIQGNLGGINFDIEDGALEIAPKLEAEIREMKKRVDQAMQGLNVLGAQGVPGVPRIDVQQGATFRMMDDQGSIELKSNDGSKEVTVRDRDNKIIWNGPWDTQQDKAAAPDDVRQRMDRLNLDTNFQGNGLRLQLNGGPIPPQPAPPKDEPK